MGPIVASTVTQDTSVISYRKVLRTYIYIHTHMVIDAYGNSRTAPLARCQKPNGPMLKSYLRAGAGDTENSAVYVLSREAEANRNLSPM